MRPLLAFLLAAMAIVFSMPASADEAANDNVFIVGSVDDPLTQRIRAELDARGIPSEVVQVEPSSPSAIVVTVQQGQPIVARRAKRLAATENVTFERTADTASMATQVAEHVRAWIKELPASEENSAEVKPEVAPPIAAKPSGFNQPHMGAWPYVAEWPWTRRVELDIGGGLSWQPDTRVGALNNLIGMRFRIGSRFWLGWKARVDWSGSTFSAPSGSADVTANWFGAHAAIALNPEPSSWNISASGGVAANVVSVHGTAKAPFVGAGETAIGWFPFATVRFGVDINSRIGLYAEPIVAWSFQRTTLRFAGGTEYDLFRPLVMMNLGVTIHCCGPQSDPAAIER